MEEVTVEIRDETAAATDLTTLRRTIYQTIMSAVDPEEAAHKLTSLVRPSQETELCTMLIACCCRRRRPERTSYYALLAQRLCAADAADQAAHLQAGFEACFARLYTMTAHRGMATDEARSAARLYAHLLATNAVWWRNVLSGVRLTEEDTTSSSRVFIKMLFQELSERLGARLLSRRMNDGDPMVREALFPTDSARNTRFAINFFTAIGLGRVTKSARERLIAPINKH